MYVRYLRTISSSVKSSTDRAEGSSALECVASHRSANSSAFDSDPQKDRKLLFCVPFVSCACIGLSYFLLKQPKCYGKTKS
jgi:hypothetical protein